MIRTVRLAMAIMVGVFAAAGLAQTRDEVLLCRSIAEPMRRLACYDALRLSPAAPAGKYEPVPLAEFAESPLAYRGRLVAVTGPVTAAAGEFSLEVDGASGKRLPLDLSALPRRVQESVRAACGETCQATVQGRVAPVAFVTGIVADNVTVH